VGDRLADLESKDPKVYKKLTAYLHKLDEYKSYEEQIQKDRDGEIFGAFYQSEMEGWEIGTSNAAYESLEQSLADTTWESGAYVNLQLREGKSQIIITIGDLATHFQTYFRSYFEETMDEDYAGIFENIEADFSGGVDPEFSQQAATERLDLLLNNYL